MDPELPSEPSFSGALRVKRGGAGQVGVQASGVRGQYQRLFPRVEAVDGPSASIRTAVRVAGFLALVYRALSLSRAVACSRCQLQPTGREKAWQPISSRTPKSKSQRASLQHLLWVPFLEAVFLRAFGWLHNRSFYSFRN